MRANGNARSRSPSTVHRRSGACAGKRDAFSRVEPVENLDRQFHFHAARHVNKSSCPNECFMQRGELSRAERSRLRHEMLCGKDLRVRSGRARAVSRSRLTAAALPGADRVAADDRPRKSSARRLRRATVERSRISARSVFIGPSAKNERREIERVYIGKTPRLIFPIRHRQRSEARPGFLLPLAKPMRQIVRPARRKAGKNRARGMFLRRFDFRHLSSTAVSLLIVDSRM